MQELQTEAFLLTKTQCCGKTPPTASGSCGDNKEHILLKAWTWQHQWLFNDPTGEIFTSGLTGGFTLKHIRAPHLAVNKMHLPSSCRGRENKSRRDAFYRACAENYKHLYNSDKALPFHVARGDHGVCVISDTPHYEVLLKHLPGWLFPLSKNQFTTLKQRGSLFLVACTFSRAPNLLR